MDHKKQLVIVFRCFRLILQQLYSPLRMSRCGKLTLRVQLPDAFGT